jgi:hypothetical protein
LNRLDAILEVSEASCFLHAALATGAHKLTKYVKTQPAAENAFVRVLVHWFAAFLRYHPTPPCSGGELEVDCIDEVHGNGEEDEIEWSQGGKER